MRGVLTAVSAGCVLLTASLRCPAQTVVVNRLVLPAVEARAATAAVALSATAGQPVAGEAEAPGARHWIGFWLPALSGAPPVLPDNLTLAKLLPDGASVALDGLVATTAPLQPDGFLYVSRPDRAAGIRVVPVSSAGAIAPGTTVSVTGTMATTDDGERQVASAVVSVEAAAYPLKPLAIAGRQLGGGALEGTLASQPGPDGGAGVNNVGLLARVWGRVSGWEGRYLVLEDAAGAEVAVWLMNAPADPPAGSLIEVTGPVSLARLSSGLRPAVIPRAPADLRRLD